MFFDITSKEVLGIFTCTYTFYMRIRKQVKRRDVRSLEESIDWRAVGRRIREMRGFELNQAQFADRLGVSQGQLSRYEQGSSEMGADVLLRLSRMSGKSIEWLLTGVERS
jgi:DNA-binding transcriptional regulator YiaG